jgi:hypothetical protein
VVRWVEDRVLCRRRQQNYHQAKQGLVLHSQVKPAGSDSDRSARPPRVLLELHEVDAGREIQVPDWGPACQEA